MIDIDAPAPQKKRWYKQLYLWVLVAIVLGILVGWLSPSTGEAMEPIGTTFITAMKMLICPIVFLTIVGGIASVADLKKVGMTGIKALTYFQVGTILAMITGLVAINLFRLGDGVNANPDAIEASDSAQKLITAGEEKQWWEFITHLVPDSVFGPFVEGDILQVIFLAVVFGCGTQRSRPDRRTRPGRGEPADGHRVQGAGLHHETGTAGRLRGHGVCDR
ncbi:hypothetical protein BH10ACT9_BH10ACT9_31500 [soil metagenome]